MQGFPAGDLGQRAADGDAVSRRSQDLRDLEHTAAERLVGMDTRKRLRTGFLPAGADPEKGEHPADGMQEVDVWKAGRETRKRMVARALNTEDQDQEEFMRKIRARMERVGIELSTVEVRFKDLHIEAGVYVGNRSLPTIINSYRNFFEGILQKMRLMGSSKTRFTILDGVSGIIPAGRMTLLLGPPGSGKSTLLMALAGKLQGSDLKIKGNITYNGQGFNKFVPQRTAAYVDQNDTHLGEITVRETFDFSARCQGVGHKADELEELLKREKEQGIKPDPILDAFMKAEVRKGKREHIVTDYMIRLLGLDICADTIVGNAMIRGISGGQKKRVTTGEMIVGPMKTLFLDEISTGLDSSSTYQIVKCLGDFTHERQATVLMSLLQPAPETYDLFDDVLLLSEGHVVYHGPRSEVLPFFKQMGFEMPERKAAPDFLQEVTSRKDQQQYWRGHGAWKFVPVAAFADAFQKYETGQRNAAALEQPFQGKEGAKSALVTEKYGLKGMRALKATLRREYLLMERNAFVYIFKAVQASLVAIITATVFLRTQLHPDGNAAAQRYGSMLFFSLVMMFFNGIAEMTFTVDRLPVFFKQRNNFLFPTWAFVLPTTIGRLPVSLVESFSWVVLTYWEVGLAPDAGRFFMYWLLIFLVHNMAISLFRAIGALSRNIVVANALGSLMLFLLLICGGFVVVYSTLHPWVVWIFWANPLAYLQRAILINEFTDPRWQNLTDPNTGLSVGRSYLSGYSWSPDYWWVWLGVGVTIAYNILFNIIIIMAHEYLGEFGGVSAVMSEDALKDREIAKTGHGADDAATVVDADAKEKERNSARRMALAGYSRQHMGSRKSLGSRRSMGSGPHSGRAMPAGASQRQVEMAQTEGLQSHPVNATENGAAHGDTKPESKRFRDVPENDQDDGMEAVAGVDPNQKGMVLPFEPLTMSFNNMHYFVDVPGEMAGKKLPQIKQVNGKDQLELLCGITSAFRPGILTCLMGVSGAGKTTLMDVLAGRKTGGVIEGDIRINGYPKVQNTFARVSGYVEQTDVHSPQTTIHEALKFSARLRFARGTPNDTILAFVDEVMELVELAPLRNGLVGVPSQSGLSVEQRKRLTIAVELVANPSIVFMDEPTSGLDARAAAIVMRTVRNIVNTGRTIVCTIHQPSIDIFESFDELLLLKRGGKTIYAGPLGTQSADLISFYEAVPGVPRIREGLNPATWMLEVTTPGQEDRLKLDFADVYQNSQLCKERQALVDKEGEPHAGMQDLKFDTRYARNYLEQYRIMLWKFNIVYFRLPPYNGVRFSFTIGLGLLFGAVFWRLGGKSGTQTDIYNILGALYTAVLFLGIMNSIFVQPVFGDERAVFYRERAAGMYAVFPWYLGLFTIEAGYLLVQTIVYTAVTYPMAWFYMSPAKFFWYLWFMFVTLLYFNCYGIAAVAITPNLLVAAVLSGAFYGIFNLFAGFVVTRGSIPGWWVWLYFLNPVSWTLYGLVASNLGDQHEKMITLPDGTVETVPTFLKNTFDYSYGFLGQCSAILIAWVIVLWTGGAYAMLKLNFQRR